MLYKRVAPKYRRAKPSTKATDKRTVAVVKRVLNKTLETKSAYYKLDGAVMLDSFMYNSNILSEVTQGILSTQVIGEKLFVKNVHYRVQLTSGAVNTSVPQCVRISVVMSRQRDNASKNFTLQTRNNYFRTPTTGSPLIQALDTHLLTVMYDKVFVLNRATTDQKIRKILDINIPVNKTLTYEVDNGTYLKDKNMYLLVTPYLDDGASYPLDWQSTVTVNFKDA